MKHIKTFESFLNENINEALYSINAAPKDPSTISIYNNGKIESDYKFAYYDNKKGWVFSSMGSQGEETRIVAKCPEDDYAEISLNVINSLKGKTWSNFDAMKKDVSAAIKTNC